MRVCSLDGCEALSTWRNMCGAHYQRWLRHGDPLAGCTSPGARLRWLTEQLATGDRSTCWVWPFAKDRKGYGRATAADGRRIKAHRLALELAGRPVPAGLVARHRCPGRPNPSCVNPDHLLVGTQTQNQLDAVDDRTKPLGERSNFAVLTDASALEAHRRLLAGETHRSVATSLGVSRSAITALAQGRSWAWLTGRGPRDWDRVVEVLR